MHKPNDDLGKSLALLASCIGLLTPLLVAVFVGVSWLAHSLPDAPIRAHIEEDLVYLTADRGSNGRKIDSFTECVGLSVGLASTGAEADAALRRAMLAPAVFGCEPFTSLLDDEAPAEAWAYYRYWHGYLAVARPLLSILSYSEVRTTIFAISVVLTLLLLARIGRAFGTPAAIAFGAPFLVVNILGFWPVATKAVTWWLACGGMLYILYRRPARLELLAGFFVLGGLTAYFDFLTAPFLIFSMAAYAVFLTRRSQKEDEIKLYAACLAFWGAGYAALWASKIAVAGLFLGPGVWGEVLDVVLLRLQGAGPRVDQFTPGAALLDNLVAMKGFYAPTAIIVFLVYPLLRAERRGLLVSIWRERPVFILIAVAPLVWMELLSNHSQVHASFTHVNYAIPFILSGLIVFDRGRTLLGAGRGVR